MEDSDEGIHSQLTGLFMAYLDRNLADEALEQPGPPLVTRSSEGSVGDPLPQSFTVLLSRINEGDPQAFDQLFPMVYRELHHIAETYLRREPRNHTLQPTALINEAYLRLVEHDSNDYQNRSHFFAISARVIRQIPVDHARVRNAARREAVKVPLHPDIEVASERSAIVVALDDALKTLSADDDRTYFRRFNRVLTEASPC